MGTVPIGTGEASMIAWRMWSMSRPVERSITVSDAEVDGRVELFQLFVHVAGDGRVADVGVDLGAGGDADPHRLEPLFEMHLVGRNDHPPAGDLVADQLRLKVLAPGDEFHLRRDPAGSG